MGTTGFGPLLAVAVMAYLLGSIPFAALFARAFRHEDIRTKGSGNAGTTNMLRTYGWGLGLLTLACDISKGALAALLGLWLVGPEGMYVASVAAVAGHDYSCFMGFHGGKGIATATGVLLVVQPVATLVIFGSCVLIVWITRIMSIGSLIGLVASAVAACCLSHGSPWNVWWAVSVIIIAVLGVWSHRGNIRRLARGEERRLGSFRRT